jgi:hexokinase
MNRVSLFLPMYSDPTDELLMIIGIFSHFFAVETTLAERQFFRALAKLIGRRAARLSACGIAAIVSKKGYLDEGCRVGADGSLYNVRVVLMFMVLMLIHASTSSEISWLCRQDT